MIRVLNYADFLFAIKRSKLYLFNNIVKLITTNPSIFYLKKIIKVIVNTSNILRITKIQVLNIMNLIENFSFFLEISSHLKDSKYTS